MHDQHVYVGKKRISITFLPLHGAGAINMSISDCSLHIQE